VDEYGTEAAAATGWGHIGGSPPHIRLDRPFLFFLHDTAGQCLFAGRIEDPSQ